ncbi:TonB-dependent receptor [Flavobacterium seoulense]|uniref:TonB-denpendent receptor n=1 Tax=Flavobacterium seoulense TaxID=1492738 RepID=A0A066WRM5_9FLAO|nr:TonB-dependent receptor [Flavobacterium seoulense]KDN56717.1 TonB-denpendent receptor [Flavobacterium seoulense]
MKLRLFILTLFITTLSFAQSKGTISGVITDKDSNNETLPFANVFVKGTKINTTTDIDGKYTISIEPGSYILQYTFVGYETKEVPVKVTNGAKLVINQSLSSGAFTLQDVVIKNTVNRQKETALLLEQKNAVEIKQNIGAQELSRKGVGDVAAAVVKTAGVSKQEGNNNIYVRGLGDRYNSTSMNGLPIPSNDPERKNIALDIFSTDIVEYISIDKVYGSRIYGDFAGGNVDIVSKDYRGDGMFEISIGSKANTNALGKNNFMLQQGPNKTGFVSYGVPNSPLSSFTFENSLNPKKETPLGGNFSLKAGKNFNIGEEGKLSLFATASFSNGYEFREGITKAVSSQGADQKSYSQEKYSYNTNTTGMFNANYRLNKNHKIGYNLLYVNSSEQARDIYVGSNTDYDNANADLQVQRGTFTQNSVFINQLLGNHKLTDKIDFNWGASYNTVESNMPDRTQNMLFHYRDNNYYNIAQRTTTDNQRYFQNLKEDEIAANMAFTYKLGNPKDGDSKGKIVAGYNGKFKKRDFEAIQFNFQLTEAGLQERVNPNSLDDFFNQQNYSNGVFSTSSFAGMTPQTYSGDQDIHAGFANLEYKLTDKLSSVLGFRYEKIAQTVEWRTQFDAGGGINTFDRNEFLPNLVLKYELNEKQNLRLAASKTYTLPQFKERALFVYEDVMESKIGNPYLYPSQNYNFDLKWEMFPKSDELFSVTAFGKYILDPINEIIIASASNDISWVNIGDTGYAYGVELEARKNIFDFDEELTNKLSFGFNASYMKTNQDIDAEKVQKETRSMLNINSTDTNSGFTGASDLILNADLSYAKNWKKDAGIIATLTYNHYSDKLYAIGNLGKGNLVDKAMGTLDFVFKTRLNKSLGIDFGARNLLNPEFKRVQENANNDVLVMNYKRGITFGLGINYQF